MNELLRAYEEAADLEREARADKEQALRDLKAELVNTGNLDCLTVNMAKVRQQMY